MYCVGLVDYEIVSVNLKRIWFQICEKKLVFCSVMVKNMEMVLKNLWDVFSKVKSLKIIIVVN